jgi:hypothetical protein
MKGTFVLRQGLECGFIFHLTSSPGNLCIPFSLIFCILDGRWVREATFALQISLFFLSENLTLMGIRF